jgi:ornithine carbamoyltransferase
VEALYRVGGLGATIGLIAASQDPPCEQCAKLRVGADGQLMPCLFAGSGVALAGMLSAGDAEGVRRALRIMAEIQFAAGATQVMPSHGDGMGYREGSAARKAIDEFTFAPLVTPVVSAHVMGGCPLGAYPRHAVVDTAGRYHHLANLYVLDASLFPTSLGANPQLSIFAIAARLSSHDHITELAQQAGVPVINAMSNLEHPCQALADIYTIWEKKKILKGLKFAYLGDGGGNVCHSLMLACTKLGMSMHVACPKEYGPEKGVLKLAEENSRKFWSALKIAPSAKLAAANADVIYTDTWVSMGEEKERAKREKAFRPFQVNSEILKHAKPDCIVMHCLPAHRGQEITDEVIDGPNSIVFDQAENRLHLQKSILTFLMGEPEKQKFRLLE